MKHIRILLAGFFILWVAVACTQPSPEIPPFDKLRTPQQQLDQARELTTKVSQLQGQVAETSGELEALGQRIASAEKGVARFASAASLPALDRTAGIPDPPSGQVAMRLSFQYQPQPLPGAGLQVYEPTSEVNSLWAMESLSAGQPLPVGNPLKDSTLFLKPGESQMVTLAYENPTSEEVGFLVLPHQESPDSLGPHVWPACLCMSFVYEAPAEGAWYRVIRVTAGPDIPPGSKVDVLWTVLTDPAVFPTEPEAMAQATPTPSEAEVAFAVGESLAAQNGCLACHSVDGSSKIGPTWKGLFGKEETLADGSKVVVDEPYLRESIVDPNAKIVKGFPANVMPQDFGQKLSDDDIQAIIEYIETLK